MASIRVARLAFNRGLVSRLGLARADIQRLAMAAETMINWIPRVLGSMMLRPGLGYLFSSQSNAQATYLPFVFDLADKALVELTNLTMRVIISDAVVTRTGVDTTISNGTFVKWITTFTVGSPSEVSAALSIDGVSTMNMTASGGLESAFSADGLATMNFVGTTTALTEAPMSSDGTSTMSLTGVTIGAAAMSTAGAATAAPVPPGRLTYAGDDNFSNDDRITLTTTGSLPAGLAVGVDYYVLNVDVGSKNFEIALTIGGDPINTLGPNFGTHSVENYEFFAAWTDADESGAMSDWKTGGFLSLVGNGSAFAIRRQNLAVSAGDLNVEHGVTIVIERGPVLFRAGTGPGGDDLVAETTLETGTHSLTVTPLTASLWVEFKQRLLRETLVDSITIDAAGDLSIPAPWATADLRTIRYDLSGDVFFVACKGYPQYRIERRATNAWSIVKYITTDGPFRVINVSGTTITASALTGNITLTASDPVFTAGMVEGLFQLVSVGQTVTTTTSADDNASTGAIRVTGIDAARGFTVTLSGFGSATVTLQRSFDEEATWIDFNAYTANTSITIDDGLDNQIIHYRLICKTGNYASGTIVMTLAITTGSITGVVRLTAFTSNLSVTAEVLVALGGVVATQDWAEGSWSTYRGFPTAVSFHEGRLTWAGQDQIKASASDGFSTFDAEIEGDSAPIQRSIGSGPVDTINWLLSMQRLIAGAEMAEFSVRSSSLDEPLTATNFNLKAASTQGSAPVAAVKVDQTGVFVQRGGQRVYELSWGASGVDYEASHLSALVPEIGAPEIVKVAVQRQPDTRIHCVRSDGTVAMLLFDKLENVVCWLDVQTDGIVEDVVVLPGDAGDKEDWVYYSVQRTIDTVTKRYLEKWAFESEVGDFTLNKQADSFLIYSQAASNVISGLTHLEAESVVVWDNNKCLTDSNGDIATFTVSGGVITVTNGGDTYLATDGIVGLPYSGSWKSAKFVELMAQQNGSLTDEQLIQGLALILADVHAKGLQFGPTLTESEMNDLPEIGPTGAVVDPDAVRSDYTVGPTAFPGTWDKDTRLCLLAKAPRPCIVLAALAELNHHG